VYKKKESEKNSSGKGEEKIGNIILLPQFTIIKKQKKYNFRTSQFTENNLEVTGVQKHLKKKCHSSR
jgi:hypothetical protein